MPNDVNIDFVDLTKYFLILSSLEYSSQYSLYKTGLDSLRLFIKDLERYKCPKYPSKLHNPYYEVEFFADWWINGKHRQNIDVYNVWIIKKYFTWRL